MIGKIVNRGTNLIFDFINTDQFANSIYEFASKQGCSTVLIVDAGDRIKCIISENTIKFMSISPDDEHRIYGSAGLPAMQDKNLNYNDMLPSSRDWQLGPIRFIYKLDSNTPFDVETFR